MQTMLSCGPNLSISSPKETPQYQDLRERWGGRRGEGKAVAESWCSPSESAATTSLMVRKASVKPGDSMVCLGTAPGPGGNGVARKEGLETVEVGAARLLYTC